MVNFFITRPIFAGVVAIIMVIAGIVGYVLLPVAQFPQIAPPQVVVSAAYPGASAQIVADTVTTPLEQQLNGVEGMAYMSSVSANDGTSTITITFNVGYDVDIAAVDPPTAQLRALNAPYANTYVFEDTYLSALVAGLTDSELTNLPNTQAAQRAAIIRWRIGLTVLARAADAPLPADLQQAGRGEIAPSPNGS